MLKVGFTNDYFKRVYYEQALFSFYKYKNEQRKFNNLEKLYEEIEEIEKSLDEHIDTVKLTIAEIKLDKLKEAYRASKLKKLK